MIPVWGAFRGLFLGGIVLWYSGAVWRSMDNYYGDQFKNYLAKEFKNNKHLRPDSPIVNTNSPKSIENPAVVNNEQNSLQESLKSKNIIGDSQNTMKVGQEENALNAGSCKKEKEHHGNFKGHMKEKLYESEIGDEMCPWTPSEEIDKGK